MSTHNSKRAKQCFDKAQKAYQEAARLRALAESERQVAAHWWRRYQEEMSK